MSDYESRREDAKREAWERLVCYGELECPACGGPMYLALRLPATRIDPECEVWVCDDCGEEVG